LIFTIIIAFLSGKYTQKKSCSYGSEQTSTTPTEQTLND